ncbi:MAG: hypothetical protein GY853_04325 [PVC group bacterium]|nr:hypothetical protein [PVC group bacterium]
MRNVKNFLYSTIIILVGIIAWHRVLDFVFFKAYEPGWLMARYNPNLSFDQLLLSLMRAHAFIYFLCYKVFGWNPMGWYGVSLVLHLLAALLIAYLTGFITKSEKTGFIAGLFFVANVAYNDVLTWGSFNAYYAFIMCAFIAAILFFGYYRKTSNRDYYLLSVVMFFLALVTRETALLIPIFIFLFDIIIIHHLKVKEFFFQNKRKLLVYIPYFVLAVAYLIFRAKFICGLSGDSMDGQVKLGMKLVAEKQYILFFSRVMLAFGRNFAAHIVPYVLLNKLPAILYSLLGWVFWGSIGLVVIAVRKNKQLFTVLFFALLWMSIQTLFISLAMPATEEILARKYLWNTRRYSYYPFFGVVLFGSVIIDHIVNVIATKKKMFHGRSNVLLWTIVWVIVAGNILMIWNVEAFVAKTVYDPSKKFFNDLKSFYPMLPEGLAIYQYPNASGLSDLFYEWNWTKELKHPNLKGQPFRSETQMARMFEKIEKKQFSFDEIYFFDYNDKDGLRDFTKEAKHWIENYQEVEISLSREIDSYFVLPKKRGAINIIPEVIISLKDEKIAPVEFPYFLEIKMKATMINDLKFPFCVSGDRLLLESDILKNVNISRENRGAIKQLPLHIGQSVLPSSLRLGIPDGESREFIKQGIMSCPVAKVMNQKDNREWFFCDFVKGQERIAEPGTQDYYLIYKYGFEDTYGGAGLVYHLSGNGTNIYSVPGTIYGHEVAGLQYARAANGDLPRKITRKDDGQIDIEFASVYNAGQGLQFGVLLNEPVLYYIPGKGVQDIAKGKYAEIKADGIRKRYEIGLSGELKALRSYWGNDILRYQPKAFIDGKMTQIVKWCGLGTNTLTVEFAQPPRRGANILIPMLVTYAPRQEDNIIITSEDKLKNKLHKSEIVNPEVLRSLTIYAKDRKEFLDKAVVSVSGTHEQWPGEPFLHFLPDNLMDGDFGDRSQWISESKPSWIVIDQGESKNVGALIWKAKAGSGRVPSTYSYYSSNDGKEWRFIKKEKGNNQTEKIDIFHPAINGRYFKMEIETTSMGDYAMLQELELVGEEASKIFTYYQIRQELIHDSKHFTSYIGSKDEMGNMLSLGLDGGWAKLSWRTRSGWEEDCFIEFPYYVDGKYHVYRLDIKEGDVYGRQGEFLKRKLHELRLDLGEFPAKYEIESIKLIPKYNLRSNNENSNSTVR